MALTPASSGNTASLASFFVVNTAGTVLTVTNLPTSDPHVVGQAWLNSGVLTVSAG